MKAVGNFVQVKEVEERGIQTPGNNLKLGEVVSIGEKCSRYIKDDDSKSPDTTYYVGKSIGSSYSNNYLTNTFIKEGMPEGFVSFAEGSKVLFDTNKSLKHGEYWYLKADSIFAYDENK